MNNKMIVLDDKTLAALDEAVKTTTLDAIESLPPMRKTYALARGMQLLRQQLSGPVLEAMLSLKDTDLGFRTDKGQYSESQVRDCLIDGIIRAHDRLGTRLTSSPVVHTLPNPTSSGGWPSCLISNSSA